MAEKKGSNRLVTIVIGIWIVVCLGAAVVAGLLFFGPSRSEALGSGIKAGEPAPDFELLDTSGESVRLSDLRGQPVVVNYWATWCGPCIQEMPTFQKYHELYSDKFVMIGIDEEEPAAKVRDFVDEFGLTYIILLDTNTVAADAYKVLTLPSTYFIDENGILSAQHIGVMTEGQFDKYMKKIGAVE